MVQEYKLPEGYYCLRNLLLIKLVHVVYKEQLGYVVELVAVSQKVPKEYKDSFIHNDFLYKRDKVHIASVFVSNEGINELELIKVKEDQLDVIKLLYSSDQSAEGTTVEANQAVSTVSDAKSGGGQK